MAILTANGSPDDAIKWPASIETPDVKLQRLRVGDTLSITASQGSEMDSQGTYPLRVPPALNLRIARARVVAPCIDVDGAHFVVVRDEDTGIHWSFQYNHVIAVDIIEPPRAPTAATRGRIGRTLE